MAGWAGDAGARLVGRERELAALRVALDGALAGHGSLVLIGGEAGVGKTTLAEALCREAADQGALVLVGRGYDLSETPPYGPWRELFDRAPLDGGLPALPAAVLPPERPGEALTSQEAIIARVRAYLAALATDRPLVILLDDLHWADPASLGLLRVLARGLAAVPLLLLATYRAEEVVRDHPLATLLPILVREARAERLDLRPLDAAAIGALVATRYALIDAEQSRLAAYLVGRTEGNALFLGELLRTLEGEEALHQDDGRWVLGDLERVPVPTLLRQVIEGRLRRLAPETARLLATAAVIGQEVPLTIWAAVDGVTEDDLLGHAEGALAARLLAEASDGSGVRFAHALIREAIYERTPAMRRRALHRRVGEMLIATLNPDPDAVANQFQRAGDPRAVEWLVRAGTRARRAAARLTAAERYTAAAALLAADSTRAGERGWLLYLDALMHFSADTTRALRHLDEASSLASLTHDRALTAHSHFLRGMVLCHHRQVRQGVAALEQGMADLEDLSGDDSGWLGDELALARLGALLPTGERPTPPPLRTSAVPTTRGQLGTLANWYGWTGHYREARATGEAIIAATPSADRFRKDVPGLWGLAHAYSVLGRPEEARREYAGGRADTYARNDPYSTAYILFAELQHAALPYRADDVPERTRLVAEAATVWERVQGSIATPYPSQADLPVALLEGRWDAARRLAEAGVAFATVGHAQSAGAALGVLARHWGDPAAAWVQVRVLHPAGPDTTPGDAFFIPGTTLQRLAVELALDAGDLVTAEEWIAAHGRWLDWSGAVLWRAEHDLLLARHARLANDPAVARAHAETALIRATEPRQPLALLTAQRTLGELATDAGSHTDAAAHLDAALALADACAAPYERALALLVLAELRHAEGQTDAASVPLAEAQAICTRLGARPALARIAALGARLAAPLDAPSLPDGLSRREAEVLRLLAAGRSNGQIAQALFLSPRTVQRHVANAYLKIGAHNKAGATTYALRHGLA